MKAADVNAFFCPFQMIVFGNADKCPLAVRPRDLPNSSTNVSWITNHAAKSKQRPSIRHGRHGAPVSTPLRWDELESEIDPQLTMDAVLK
jgi:hypothetical protein